MTAAPAAVQNMLGAIEDGDRRASLALLRGLGLLSGGKPEFGSSDAKRLQEDKEREESETEGFRLMRSLYPGLLLK
jgi:hypothetical protein